MARFPVRASDCDTRLCAHHDGEIVRCSGSLDWLESCALRLNGSYIRNATCPSPRPSRPVDIPSHPTVGFSMRGAGAPPPARSAGATWACSSGDARRPVRVRDDLRRWVVGDGGGERVVDNGGRRVWPRVAPGSRVDGVRPQRRSGSISRRRPVLSSCSGRAGDEPLGGCRHALTLDASASRPGLRAECRLKRGA